MTMKNEKRLCWNCDGTIAFDLSQCPYCGVAIETASFSEPQAIHNAAEENLISDSIALVNNNELHESKPLEDAQEKKELTALLLILPGTTLALFGALLFFFAKNGTLTLALRGQFAYLYLLGALPLLLLGWRALK